MIIDDEESTRELLKLSLEADGYEVLVSEDGPSGLAVYEASRPEIVLTDIKMPGMDGIEVLRRLKSINPDVQVIVITGHGEMELAIRALQLEASDFISKPISDLALSIALRRALEKIWMRKKLREYVTGLESGMKDAAFEIRKRKDFEYQLIDTSMDGIIANDQSGKIIKFNAGASRICGYTTGEAVYSMNVSQLYPPGEARNIKKTIYGPEYGGPGRLINYQTEVLAKDGRAIPILLSATLIHDESREVATVGFFKDLTEIKQLQRELLQKTRMAAIGEAIAEMAHGVKNILYGIKLGAFMLEKGLHGDNPEKVKKGWQTVSHNIARISKLSLDMLSYTRKTASSRVPVQLNEIIGETCLSLAGRAEKKGVVLRQRLAPGLPCVRGNPEGLHTCLLNLVTNAIEAIPESAPDAEVTVCTEAGKGCICLKVSDTGRGIGPELQKQIFKPLFSTKGARGTGLGLAITEKIVKEHDGSITVRSRLQKGTTFTITLPAKASDSPDEGPPLGENS